MHELSIAMGIVKIAEKEAEKLNISEVKAIDLGDIDNTMS